MDEIRADFPQLSEHYIYFDNAATSLKPQCVIDELNDFYTHKNINVHNSLSSLGFEINEEYEAARKTVADFINANAEEIIFTSGATDSINALAKSLKISIDDKIVISIAEHHSNMLPWRNASRNIDYLYCDENFNFSDNELARIDEKTKLVAITAYSNILGPNEQLADIINKAHQAGALVVVDAAQAIAHQIIDVKKMDADFLVFSGHKLYGPMGIGVLYGKKELLASLRPFRWGGGMVDEVDKSSFTLSEMPYRFEAGTPNVAGALGLAKAINYLNEYNYNTLLEYEQKLCTYAFEKIRNIPYLELAGAARSFNISTSVLCLWLNNIHSHDVLNLLDKNNIIARAGFHCAQPLLEQIGKGPVTRISLSFYNSYEEVDQLIEVLSKARKEMGFND